MMAEYIVTTEEDDKKTSNFDDKSVCAIFGLAFTALFLKIGLFLQIALSMALF